MKYRDFNELGWQVSVLGLGTMWLPPDDGEAREIIRLAVDGGVNYIDCRYTDAGEEERLCRLIGETTTTETRVCVSLLIRSNITQVDIASFVAQRAGWLGRKSIDFLMLAGLDRDTWPLVRDSGVLADIEDVMATGEIQSLGFSFRDQFLYLRQVIDGYDGWTFGEFNYSFMDDDHLPGTSGLSYAVQKGLAVIAAEPLKCGQLVRNIPEDIAGMWASRPGRSPAAWALDWVWHHAQVSTAVVDMSSIEEVRENLALAEKAREGSLSVMDEVLVSRVRDAYRSRRAMNCDTCRACMPCHNGIDAPRIFELLNDAAMYGDIETNRRLYRLEGHDISVCDECGSCARACGRHIDIPAKIREADRLFRTAV